MFRRGKVEPRVIDNGGVYGFEVVGESLHRDDLARIAARFAAEERSACRGYTFAQLVREPKNPYDPNAVAVQIDGRDVGHVSARHASVVGAAVARYEQAGNSLWARAVIVWRDDISESDYGVWLDIPHGDDIAAAPTVPLSDAPHKPADRSNGSGTPSAPMPPAAWYPNPTGDGQRYWDGTKWTEHYAP